MKFIGGSPISDQGLAKLSQKMVELHGENAPNVVNRLIDEANVAGDFADHATWTNVALGVLQILRPHRPVNDR